MIHLAPLSTLCYALGYGTGIAAFAWMARRRGLATPGIMALLGAGLVGGLAGANLGQWLTVGSEGKSVLGAIAGGYAAVFLYKRYLGIVRPTGDLFAVALCAGEAVGRWGCFFGGCCYGKASHVAWAVWQHGAWRHPTQIYLSLASLLILGCLLLFERTDPRENALFYFQGLLYCASRFAIEFFRETPPPIAGLTAAQWACIAGFAYFTIQFVRLTSNKESNTRGIHSAMPELR